MAKFVITYLGGNQPTTAEEGQQHFAKYKEWLTFLGGSAISPANPFKNTQTIAPTGEVTNGGSTNMSGFTIIEVDSMETALAAAKRCPFLELGGSLEVSELMQMSF